MMLLWELFRTFFVIGLFNFGGGGAMLSLIQAEVVSRHAWISEGQFTDIVAISQTTPGPIGINCATYVGYEVAGIGGSAAATLALVLPSFLLFLLIVRFYGHYHSHPAFIRTMDALRPVVTGLIGAAALALMFRTSWHHGIPECTVLRETFPDWKSWILMGAALAASLLKNINPIVLILAGAIAGLILY